MTTPITPTGKRLRTAFTFHIGEDAPGMDSLVDGELLPDMIVAIEHEAAKAAIAGLEEACDARGLPHDLVGLIRHIENNAAATVAFWKMAAEQAAKAERERCCQHHGRCVLCSPAPPGLTLADPEDQT